MASSRGVIPLLFYRGVLLLTEWPKQRQYAELGDGRHARFTFLAALPDF